MPTIDTSDDATGDPGRARRHHVDTSADASGSRGDEFMGLDFDGMFPSRRVHVTTNRHAQRIRIAGAWAGITPAVITCGYLLVEDRPFHAALMFIGTALLVGLGILVNPPLITIRPASEITPFLSARPGEWGSTEDYQRPWPLRRNREDRQAGPRQ